MSEPHPPKHLSRRKELSLRIATITTFLSLIPTAYVAFSSNSIVLLTDLLRCSVEFSAIFLSWLIVRSLSSKNQIQSDYSFGKMEQMGSLLVACALFLSFIAVLVLAAIRIYSPVAVENGGLGLIFAILSILGNISFWIYNNRLARSASSPILESQSNLFRAKTLASVVVATSLLLSLGKWESPIMLYADPLGSLILAGFLLFSAITLLSSSMRGLLDSSIDEVLRLKVLHALAKHDGSYLGLESATTRLEGKKAIIEITLEFSENAVFSEINKAMEEISSDLTNSIGNCSVIIIPKAR